MAILTREQMLERIKGFVGENNSDEVLGLIEDIEDTTTDYETRLKDQTDWKQKYVENDNNWRNKYKERFFSGTPIEEPKQNYDMGEQPKTLSFDDLFKEEK